MRLPPEDVDVQCGHAISPAVRAAIIARASDIFEALQPSMPSLSIELSAITAIQCRYLLEIYGKEYTEENVLKLGHATRSAIEIVMTEIDD